MRKIIAELVKQADIIVGAVGKAELIQKDLNDLGLEMMTFQKKGSKNNTQSLNVIHEKEDEDKLDSAKKHCKLIIIYTYLY